MIDLFCLVADKNMEAAISGLLERPESLGMREIEYEVRVHDRRDPGCYHYSQEYLQGYQSRAHHALVILDHAWDGVPAETAEEVEQMLEGRLEQDGFDDWARAVVIEPELESWVFAGSPHVASVLGWSGRHGELPDALANVGLWPAGATKPHDPKAAMEWVLEQARIPRSSSLYRELAGRVSTRSCTDRAFQRFRGLLRDWFGAHGRELPPE